ncbi:MAG: S9 family peptidase [Chloroflexi bacterium]|nr:S9 family peptidase [Chloroflexota bacterium]
MPAKRHITAEDLYLLQIVTGSELSPDGQHVVFSLQRVDREKEKKYSNLWIVPTRGGEARQFTIGDHVDSSPRWSPDGLSIAFISNRDDEKQSQLYIIPFQGGEARLLTHMHGEFASIAWSPDGKRFVCQFRKTDPDEIEREKDERKKELGIVYRQISRVFYKLDGKGYLPKDRWHLWTIDARTGRSRQLTSSPVFDDIDPCWSPDGRQIAFCSNHSPDPDFNPNAIDLFVIDAAGGAEHKIDTPAGPKTSPAFSPDGSWIAYLGQEGLHAEWKNMNLWVVPADGSGKAQNITGAFDFNVSAWTINDTGASTQMPPTWSPDSDRIYFQVARHGNTELQSIRVDGRDLHTVVEDRGVVSQYNFDRTGSTLAYFFGEMFDPGQIHVREMGTQTDRKITKINRDLLDRLELGEIEEGWFKGPAENDLQGWILKPPGFDVKKKYPSILEIHGGPLVQYGNFFMFEFFYLAAAGYVVYFCNPRGGQGYGEEHARAIQGAWGTVDYDDLMAWVDFVCQKPYIDPERMGVTGGSYGGYMTNWIIGHTQRFKAAVTQRSVSNLISMWGSSDFNWVFQETFDDKAPYESIEALWRCSPLQYLGNARTPTLVLHNQQDLRCAIEQGEQVFVALKKLGVDTELIVFPDEPHGLSRIGRTDRRIARLNHIRRWFDKYLMEQES